ncbi:unnamed protein product [Staurois parvus]|uniref:Uncharacterized protein n=1 Tax=Staurois parvus TaxID=386267 RepID=A0ABN9FN67_9NEOB|nr:unnamed protein product [Staurois parvus]
METLHMLNLVCFSWESACDQHRANQHCPDKGQGFCILLEKTPSTSFNQCLSGHR